MSDLRPIIQEKLQQAVGLLNEQNVDCWLTFVRETSQTHDPALDLILGAGMTWDSAFIVSRSGERIAIVGRYDAEIVRRLDAYTDVVGYDQGIAEALRARLSRLNPANLALNYSLSDPGADGLTFGMYARLMQMLAGLPCVSHVVSAEGLVRRLRERKTATEIERIRAAIGFTQQVYAELATLPLVGMSEKQIHDAALQSMARCGCEPGWEAESDPMVNAGPDSPVGHGMPTDLVFQRGQLLHFDMGLRLDGYCSDLQRVFYAQREGEDAVPAEITRAWQACRGALEAGRAALKPGVIATEVDAAARGELVRQGYPEYMHAFGHHVGRNVHDGGSVLGPRWERYGDLPNKTIDPGDVFAIELGAAVPGFGYVGIEENVVVTANGAEYLSEPQVELVVL
jgi:Xaa-Pro aminopeptidase